MDPFVLTVHLTVGGVVEVSVTNIDVVTAGETEVDVAMACPVPGASPFKVTCSSPDASSPPTVADTLEDVLPVESSTATVIPAGQVIGLPLLSLHATSTGSVPPVVTVWLVIVEPPLTQAIEPRVGPAEVTVIVAEPEPPVEIV